MLTRGPQWIRNRQTYIITGCWVEKIMLQLGILCVYKPPIQLVAKTSLFLPSFLVDTHKCTQMPLFRRHSDGRWWFCLVSVLSRIQRVRCASAPTAPLRSFLPSLLLQDLRATRLNPWCVHACVWECLMGRGFEGKQYLSFLWIKRGGGRGEDKSSRVVFLWFLWISAIWDLCHKTLRFHGTWKMTVIQ